jgi:hypothetical protein
MGMDHSHMPIEVPENANKVSLSLDLSKDAMSGYNLTLRTENYHFVPPPTGLQMKDLMEASINTSTGSVEGHAHLYVNGNKVQRVYGNHIHLPQKLFSDGINSISITLNNHGHMYWTHGAKQIISTLFINENKANLIAHKFESFPVAK